jgi:hypothetical protein
MFKSSVTVLAMFCLVVSVFSEETTGNADTVVSFKEGFSKPDILFSSWKSEGAKGDFLFNAVEGNRAEGALAIAIKDGCPADAAFVFMKKFPSLPGKTYNAILWVKAENVDPDSFISLSFQGMDSEGKTLGTPIFENKKNFAHMKKGWQRFILTFTVPNGGLWAKTSNLLCTFGIGKSAHGMVYFDDFEFFETKKTENTYREDFSGESPIWGSWKSDTAVGKFQFNEEEGHTAKGSLEIVLGEGCPADAAFCFTKRFPVVCGKTYNAIVWVKAEGVDPSVNISLSFQGQDSEDKFLGTPIVACSKIGAENKKGWQRFILTFSVPKEGLWSKTGNLLCTMGLEKSAHGRVNFDDFEFFESKE